MAIKRFRGLQWTSSPGLFEQAFFLLSIQYAFTMCFASNYSSEAPSINLVSIDVRGTSL
jgi:hypothetical protein